jgi:hypothetical protein
VVRVCEGSGTAAWGFASSGRLRGSSADTHTRRVALKEFDQRGLSAHSVLPQAQWTEDVGITRPHRSFGARERRSVYVRCRSGKALVNDLKRPFSAPRVSVE